MKYFLTAFLIITFFENGNGQAPDWQWGESLYGSGNIEFRSSVLDINGNIYTTGRFSGTIDFDSGNGVFEMSSNGSYNIFITKFDPSGYLVWAKQVLGLYDDCGNSLAIDQGGNIYVTGFFGGPTQTDFDPDSINTFYLTADGIDIFVLKLNNNGEFIWARSAGGSGLDLGNSIKVDTIGNDDVYITGHFESTVDFDPGPGFFYLTSSGSLAGFIYKLDSAGVFKFAKPLQSSNQLDLRSLGLATNGDLLLTGSFIGITDFDPDSLNSFSLSSDSTKSDILIARYNNLGNLIWALRVGSTNSDAGSAITVDVDGNIYITGYFTGNVDFDPDSVSSYYPHYYQLKNSSFILKLDNNGKFLFVKSIVGTLSNLGVNICLGPPNSKNVFVTGRFRGVTDFDPDSTGVFNLVSDTVSARFFISKYDTAGTFQWAKMSEGFSSSFSPSYSIVTDLYGNSFVAGYFTDTIIFKNDTLEIDSGIQTGGYLAKLGTCSSHFFLYPDTAQSHHYYAVNESMGIPPLQYDWSWGDGNHDYTAYPNHVYADSGYYDICLTINDSVGCSSTYCDSSFYLARRTSSGSMVYVNVVDQIVTSLVETTSINGLTIAPNPATNKLTIHSTLDAIHSIEIFGLTGELIFSNQFPSNKFSTEMSLENWKPGIYFVKIKTENGSTVQKLLIQ